MSRDREPPDAKKRRRQARGALLHLRRRLLRLCAQFTRAEKTAQDWYASVKSYVEPVLQAYPDLIPEGVRERVQGVLGIADQTQQGVHRACELLKGELDGLIKDISDRLGVEGKLREMVRPLTEPIAGLLEASPLVKVVAAVLVVVFTGSTVAGAVVLTSGGGAAALRDPDAVVSTSHQLSRPSTDNTVDVTWQPEPSAAGFSVQWSQQALDLPDEVVDLPGTVTAVTSPPLAPGAWYFHLRTQNRDGQWTSTVHLGPFVIEAVAAPTPTATPTPAPATPTPTATVNRPPVVSPITAVFRPTDQTTIYSVTASDPEGARLMLTWSGPNCGTTGTPAVGSFFWRHPHVPGDPASCPASTDHADVTIVLTVSDGPNTLICSYRGATSGTGPACR